MPNCHSVLVHGSESRPIRVEIYESGYNPEDQGDGPIVFQIEYRHSVAYAYAWYGTRAFELSGLWDIQSAISACVDYETLDEYMDVMMREYGSQGVDDDREERALNVEFMKGSGVYE